MTSVSEYVQVAFDKIIQTRVYTAIVLRSQKSRFAIYSEATTGRMIQMHLGNEERARPYTHDLMKSIFSSLQVRVKQVVITDVQDSIFFSKLFLETEKEGLTHIVEIDSRPSDSIILAFFHNAPVFCTNDVLEKAVPFVD